ncbi:hypothetical protein EI200_04320 [Peribacillus simplex]|uniref:hypothetical protein n=1 Tax=Peribacillus simplex TaxID=1478 RepID=UPI000F644598|nr:hypothetical protein [Peribacillus simplex]RRN73912.1 hypothetical protein EI200_04320 [Peribacillus simplex]
MRLVLQAFIGSIALHVLYIVSLMLVSIIKTKNYKPDIVSAWDKVDTLRKEVEIVGKVIPPYFYVLSFVGVASICGIIILIYSKIWN